MTKISPEWLAGSAIFIWAARISEAPLELVEGCFIRAMVYSNQNPENGSIAGIDLELIARIYRQPVKLIEAIFDGFRRVGFIVDDRFALPSDPPTTKARAAAAARQRRFRERKRATQSRVGGQP